MDLQLPELKVKEEVEIAELEGHEDADCEDKGDISLAMTSSEEDHQADNNKRLQKEDARNPDWRRYQEIAQTSHELQLQADEEENKDWQKYKSIVQSVVSRIIKGPEVPAEPGAIQDPTHYPEAEESEPSPQQAKQESTDAPVHKSKGKSNGVTAADKPSKKKKVYVCNEEKPFICSVCGDGFTQKGSMTIHMRSHSGEKPFACMFCGKAFTRRHILTEHLRTHSGETPFTCTVCGKSFSQERNLNRHLTIHSGEKPYTCTECGKGFNVQSNLTRHMTIHSGEKPYTCVECGKGFNVQSNLTTHMRIHSGERPYTCEVCGKGFSVAQHLQTHMRTHSGDRPYVCAYCGKGFAQHSNLATHLRIHSGEKPYTCELCGRSFREQGKLTRHMKVHDKATSQLSLPEAVSTDESSDNTSSATEKPYVRTHSTAKTSEGRPMEQAINFTHESTNEKMLTNRARDFSYVNENSSDEQSTGIPLHFTSAITKTHMS